MPVSLKVLVFVSNLRSPAPTKVGLLYSIHRCSIDQSHSDTGAFDRNNVFTSWWGTHTHTHTHTHITSVASHSVKIKIKIFNMTKKAQKLEL
jgi:hypothetical protein